jgi:hypothetical protein
MVKNSSSSGGTNLWTIENFIDKSLDISSCSRSLVFRNFQDDNVQKGK